jgi:hypothetical protein
LLLSVIVLALATAACTGGDDPTPSASDPGTATVPGGTPLPTDDPGAVAFEPGLFRYSFDAVSAELRWQGGRGELTVENGSDRELGEPGLYAVTSDQREVPAEVVGTAPVGAGEAATFTFSFPNTVAFEQTGFVVLLFGDENWGAFAPVPVDEA